MIRAVSILLLFAGGLFPSAAPTLESALALLDSAGRSFRSMSGEMKKVTHTAILNDDSTESGTVRVKQTGSKGLTMLIEVREPDPKAYAFEGKKAEIYYPKMKTVQIYDLGKHSNLVDQFLLLGFGTSASELQKSYTLRLAGKERVAGIETTRLELVPKSAKTREHLSQAELWISTADGRTVQQKFTEPSGDYRLITYTQTKWNPNLSDSDVKLNLPKDVKREYPQK
ncbi:MAG: outer membrane lipoprotein carrier protein LolA [Bryobacterales bacterium]|nr:outer membrane lipoprotein carrier protein LolA [Bryobacterales bacterium]MEB2359867.1 outer membrane lipoprotein carrier protein LolA [Bryobacterales bacterium]